MAANSKTLLRVPELVEAVNQFVLKPVNHKDIFRLIGEGDIKPFGYLQRIPVFAVEQIKDVVEEFQNIAAREIAEKLKRNEGYKLGVDDG